jgi:hypothetical protein
MLMEVAHRQQEVEHKVPFLVFFLNPCGENTGKELQIL